MAQIVITKDFQRKNSPQYFKEFSTFYNTWLLNKYIGGGIKNFRYYCHKRDNIDIPISAGALSWYLLWGESTNLNENIKKFKKKFNV